MTTDQINSQLGAIGYKSDPGKNSIALHNQIIEEASTILKDEIISNALFGISRGTIGLLIATDKRMLFIGKMAVQNKTVIEQFHYDKLSALDYKKGGFFPTAELKFYEGSEKIEISGCSPELAKKFADALNLKIQNFKATASPINQPIDIAGQLEKFAKLKEQGIITDEEFQTQKTKLLSL